MASGNELEPQEQWEEVFTGSGGAEVRLSYHEDRNLAFTLELRSGSDSARVYFSPGEAYEAGDNLAQLLERERLFGGDRMELDGLEAEDYTYYYALDISYHEFGPGMGGFLLSYASWDGGNGERCNVLLERPAVEGLAEALKRDTPLPE